MDEMPFSQLAEQIKKLISETTRVKRDNAELKKQVAVLTMECKLLEEKQQKAKQKVQQLLDKLAQHEGIPNV